MGFWDTLKSWFGVYTPEPAPVPPDATEGDEPGVAGAPRKGARPDTYEASSILGLSAEALRRRALSVNPFRTAFIWRTDIIPPQTDERTAIIDRGLILRGLLTREQLREIHRVGDLWLQFKEAARLAASLGERKGIEAVAAKRAAAAEAKRLKRQQAEERRAARSRAVADRKQNDIIFAGRGVSHKLGDRRANVEALGALHLPLLATPKDLADVLGIRVPELRWLAFHHESPERTHYVYFEIPKRSGGQRLIASPRRHLRRAQSFILREILSKVDVTEHAHGFVQGRSTVSNARAHLARHVVVNQDLADFFPHVTFPRVRGLFESLGYSPAVATLLALLCTEAPRSLVELEGRRHWVAVRERSLPQGACTSPAISNLVARKLDRRLNGAAAKLGFSYSRYADDLTFSAGSAEANIGLLLARVRHIVHDEGFALNPKKGRVQRRNRRQEVTGIVVNDKLGVSRAELRKLRAILHNAKQTGLAAQNREQHPQFQAWLRGKIGYVMMVDPVKGRVLADALATCKD